MRKQLGKLAFLDQVQPSIGRQLKWRGAFSCIISNSIHNGNTPPRMQER
jgi:hypothetical protein